MFGIGIPELIIIAAVALVFIGPDKLPSVLRSIGKGIVELKRATSDVRSTVQDEMHKIEEEIELKEIRKSAEEFSNELGGVANKQDQLSLSKINSEEQIEGIDEKIAEPKKDISVRETNLDEKNESSELRPENFVAPKNDKENV
tara:strand:+ start:218 stop:649 length:432 start_codon:yes stop_codon:yes gene_type:complete